MNFGPAPLCLDFSIFGPLCYLSKYGLVAEDFVTNDIFEIDNYTKFSKPWQDIFHEGSFRIGNDFKISLSMRDNSLSVELESLELNEEQSNLVEIGETYRHGQPNLEF